MKRLTFFLFFGLILLSLGRLPYLNLIINPLVLVSILWIMATMMWHISFRVQFILSLIFVVIALGLILMRKPDVAETIANFVYLLLWIGSLQLIRTIVNSKA